MRTTLVFSGVGYDQLADRLLSSNEEQCAVLLATPVSIGSGYRLLIREEFTIGPSDFSRRSAINAELRSETVFRVAQAAKAKKLAPVFVHTHPFSVGIPYFSEVDAAGELALAAFFSRVLPEVPVTSVVVGKSGCSARLIPSASKVEVLQLGACRRFYSETQSSIGSNQEKHNDRQIRAFGRLGQRILSDLKIGVVGLGGTGSLIVQQLSYLGVRNYVLIDPDSVDVSNLNRLVGATSDDVNQAKITVADRLIKRTIADALVEGYQESVLDDGTARRLIPCDLVFGCTDSHGSRAVLNQFAYQYFVPVIDMGVSITAAKGSVTHISGRVQALSPGLGCLTCGELLDAGAVRQDFLLESQKRDDPYFLGEGEPQPAVISINSTVSSLAITMFLGLVTHVPVAARFQIYDGMRGTVRVVNHLPHNSCVVCSVAGALGRGDCWPLPTRMPM